jgi:hypothetical protein
MANNPLNLAVRFGLELAALWAMGYWGWTQHAGPARWLWMLGLPLIAAAAWGTFRVPNDPGPAPVAVRGWVRLLIEAAVFGGAVWALFAAGRGGWAWVLAAIVAVHYAVSYDRIGWLLRR